MGGDSLMTKDIKDLMLNVILAESRGIPGAVAGLSWIEEFMGIKAAQEVAEYVEQRLEKLGILDEQDVAELQEIRKGSVH